MPARILAGAMCVQRFDDSLNSAIHITYRISLRSSSMPEPRDPLLKVLTYSVQKTQRGRTVFKSLGSPPAGRPGAPGGCREDARGRPAEATVQGLDNFPALSGRCRPLWASPKASLSHSIGSSDGRDSSLKSNNCNALSPARQTRVRPRTSKGITDLLLPQTSIGLSR
ncbi:hypothetical protein VTK26DRAFT_1635 [Humicola hyalothermophila]